MELLPKLMIELSIASYGFNSNFKVCSGALLEEKDIQNISGYSREVMHCNLPKPVPIIDDRNKL